ncbi:uncharacterized protein [Cicer arietinum]|uniref:Uncharacterized protein LOC101495049 n=1 Tax=Cicer arietinum TaxID=3827 RepID=A0A1S2XGX8_CICAR|nr:uncharacterized protein LOC101495049 [Cicer arietinum]
MEAISYIQSSFSDSNPLPFPTKNHLVTLNTTTPFTLISRASFVRLKHHTPINIHYSKNVTTNVPSSNPCSFAQSYLIKNLNFSSHSALKTSIEARFNTPNKPDLVIDLFKKWGFSNTNLRNIMAKEPWLHSCNPNKRVLPKFQFLLSKGASNTEIIYIVTKTPTFLRRSLDNHIVPTYELLIGYLQSDKETLNCIIRNPLSFCCTRMRTNVKLLVDFGVSDSTIVTLLHKWPSVFSSNNLLREIEELKELGFNPLKSAFSIALLAKLTVRKSHWDDKVNVFKKWGWSDENVVEAFRRQPNCMLASCDKINNVMEFWVNELGMDAMELVKGTNIFGLSLEKRVIPRGFVVQYMLAKGLIDKNASLITPFLITEEMFLKKFVMCFKENDTSYMLKIYQDKMNVQDYKEGSSIKPSLNCD